jgi:hypothetical protein
LIKLLLLFESELLAVTWQTKSMNISFEGEKSKDLTEQVISNLKEEGMKEHNSVALAQYDKRDDGGDTTTVKCETSAH